MYWNKKNDPNGQEKKMVNVEVWECESDDCLGWMRKDFSFTEDPKCPLCGSAMKSGERLLQELSN
ncbi:cold-inducible protein YdjO-related protein [Microbacteriaceae bacterium 4G12]